MILLVWIYVSFAIEIYGNIHMEIVELTIELSQWSLSLVYLIRCN